MSKKSKKKQKKPDNALEANFKEGDLVGAKVKGHPLWPGYIEKVNFLNNRRKYTVRFFGSNDTSQSCIQIKYFKDFTSQEKACSRKGFKDALMLCQEKYDSLEIGDDDDDDDQEDGEEVEEENSAPDKSLDSPQHHESDKLVIENDKGSSIDDIKSEKESTTSPPDATTSMEIEDDKEGTVEVPSIAKDDTMQTKSPKSEGENVAEVSVFDSALAKLKEKVAKKLEEKEARKIELKELKMSSKVSAKLAVINKKMKRFSRTVKKLSIAKPINQSNIDEWNLAVRMYDSVFPYLHKCIKYYSENNSTKHGDSDLINYRECQKILIEIFSDVKGAIKNAQAHDGFKKELRKFKEKMKSNDDVKEFIDQQEPETFKNAMIERRDNDAEL